MSACVEPETLAILRRYPKTSPWDLVPTLRNITPQAPAGNDDPAIIEAARDEVRKGKLNPLSNMLGTNPFCIREYLTPTPKLPIHDYQTPSLVPRVTLADDVKFIRLLDPESNTPIYLIRLASGEVRLLKVFPEAEESEDPGYEPDFFSQELDAYAHLLHYGACDAGIVPRCYGWLELSRADIVKVQLLKQNKNRPIRQTGHPPKALLLEYFADAQRLTIFNLTYEYADAALKALRRIHASYVLHCDIARRNILLLPNGRVVWVDFDHSVCMSRLYTPVRRFPAPRVTRQTLLGELETGWALFYNDMLPDKLLGFQHWTY